MPQIYSAQVLISGHISFGLWGIIPPCRALRTNLRSQIAMCNPKTVHNDQSLKQLDGDDLSVWFPPRFPKLFHKVAVLNELHSNSDEVLILE